MSSKRSLIMSLYEQTKGATQSTQPSGTRLVSTTNTLLNETIKTSEFEPHKEQTEDMLLESREYEEVVNRLKNLFVINKRRLMPGDRIRIVETKGLVPTGRSITKTVKDIIVGTNENGVCSGKMVIALQDVMW